MLPASHVEAINRDAYEKIRGYLSRSLESQGHCYLLYSPRAGYGKTHLLSKLRGELSLTHEMILLHPYDGLRIDAESVFTDVMTHVTRLLPAGGGLTSLDLLARRIIALGIEPLILSGELPCQDRDQALHAFVYRPIETFDFHHPAAATAHWVRKNFEILRLRIAEEISTIVHAPAAAVSFWIDAMFQYAVTPMDEVKRSQEILEAKADKSLLSMAEILTTFLTLLSHTHRVVLVADELEGFSTNEEAALRLVSFLTSLRSQAGRMDVMLSVNGDVWENAFLPKIPSGLLDRISEFTVRLEPMSRDEAMMLLASRHQGAARLVDHMNPEHVVYARSALRHAGMIWNEVGVEYLSSFTASGVAVGGEELHFSAGNTDANPAATEESEQVHGRDATSVDVAETEVSSEEETVKPIEGNPVFMQTFDLGSADANFATVVSDTPEDDLASPSVFSKSPLKVAQDFQCLSSKEDSSEPLPQENDQVADLLRQFRERYRDSMS